MTDRKLLIAQGVAALQAVAAVYFVVDSIYDGVNDTVGGTGFAAIFEFLVAFALLAGIVISARHAARLRAEAQRRDQALAIARGALSDLVALRFEEWKLSVAEAEVALFALKGCSIAEIAKLRQSAGGTVRSQLSQVYAKAEVTSQAMLISLFFDELLDHDFGLKQT